MPSPRIIAVGRRLTDDLLIWDQIGQALEPSKEHPVVILHGPGEMTERALEGDGLSLDDAGRDLATDQLIEAAFRQENRKAASALTDAGVPAVGFLGLDRRMITCAESTEVRMNLVSTMASTGGVPVIGAVCRRAGDLRFPTLASVVEGVLRAPESVSGVEWLVFGRLDEKISRAAVRARSGEPELPGSGNMEGVSVRVLEVSALGMRSGSAGARLED